MLYTKKDLSSYQLHLINTNKFKTITIRVVFRCPIIKEDITKRNVLCDMFMQSSKNYNSKSIVFICLWKNIRRESKTKNKGYPMNICRHCGSGQGWYFIYRDINNAIKNKEKIQAFDK